MIMSVIISTLHEILR